MFISCRKFYRKLFWHPPSQQQCCSCLCVSTTPVPLPDNNLLTHSTYKILLKSSFWRSVHVYWQMKQHNNNITVYCNWKSCGCNAANLIKFGSTAYVSLIHSNTFCIGMHVKITIYLDLNQCQLLLQQTYYSPEAGPRTPQHLRWRSSQQLWTAESC